MDIVLKHILEEQEKLVKASEDFVAFNNTHSREESIEYANRIRKEFHYVWTLNTYNHKEAHKIKEGMMELLLGYKYFVEGKD